MAGDLFSLSLFKAKKKNQSIQKRENKLPQIHEEDM